MEQKFEVGQKVEYKGKMVKVLKVGRLELPTETRDLTAAPGFTEDDVADVLLPAETPGGLPVIEHGVALGKIKALNDNPKRQHELELEFNPLFGDPAPAPLTATYNSPVLHERVGKKRGDVKPVAAKPTKVEQKKGPGRPATESETKASDEWERTHGPFKLSHPVVRSAKKAAKKVTEKAPIVKKVTKAPVAKKAAKKAR